jgi:ribonuclease J
MTKLTFYGGVNEIGGNKILLEDKGTKIFLDFGQSFTFGSEFFTSWLQLRGPKILSEHL